jgi:hypothetical protein
MLFSLVDGKPVSGALLSYSHDQLFHEKTQKDAKQLFHTDEHGMAVIEGDGENVYASYGFVSFVFTRPTTCFIIDCDTLHACFIWRAKPACG